MARNKKQPVEKTLWEKAKWEGFVPIRLSSQEKEEIKASLLTRESIAQFFEDAASAGYKVSVSYSIPEEVFTVALTGSYQRKPNAGLTASVRHVEFDTAVSALWFVTNEDGYAVDWEARFGKEFKDNW